MATVSQPKEDEEEEPWDSRAEAKRAHADRMAALRFAEDYTGVTAANDAAASLAAEREEEPSSSAEAKAPAQLTAFEIAVAIANSSEDKVNLFLSCFFSSEKQLLN